MLHCSPPAQFRIIQVSKLPQARRTKKLHPGNCAKQDWYLWWRNYTSTDNSHAGMVLCVNRLVIVLNELQLHDYQEVINHTIKGKAGDMWLSLEQQCQGYTWWRATTLYIPSISQCNCSAFIFQCIDILINFFSWNIYRD